MRYHLAYLLTLTTLALFSSLTPVQEVCPDYDTCMVRAKISTSTDPDFALDLFRAAKRFNPFSSEACTHLNLLEAKLNGTTGTCATYNSCMAQGYASSKQGQHLEAMTHFRRAIGFTPNNAEAHKAISTICRGGIYH